VLKQSDELDTKEKTEKKQEGMTAYGKIQLMKILLANPRGFCAGVDRAIEIVKRALELFGAPVYVRHQIVHNRFVVQSLEAIGAVFVKRTKRCTRWFYRYF